MWDYFLDELYKMAAPMSVLHAVEGYKRLKPEVFGNK